LIERLEPRALFSGELDTAFGTDGSVVTDFDAYADHFARVAAGPNGTTYAAGYSGGTYFVARYTVEGRLDAGFNNGLGYVPAPVSTDALSIRMAVSPNGTVYLGGSSYERGDAKACIVAITPAGALDMTFNGDGVWTGKWSGDGYENAIIGLSYYEGRLYAGVAGFRTCGVARFTPAGELDPTFGTAGSGRTLRAIDSIIYMADFTLVTPAGGQPHLLLAAGLSQGTVVTKYDLAGTPDSTFSNALLYSFYTSNLATDAGGRIYLGGRISSQTTIARLTTDGLADASFTSVDSDRPGFRTLPNPAATSVTSLKVLPVNGSARSQVFLTTRSATGPQAVLLDENGVPNRSFGTDGVLPLPISGVADATRQGDGKILIAGYRLLADDRVDTQLLRLNAPPAPTQISGYLFDDVNADGLRNDRSTRTTFYGIGAYLDLNNDGDADFNEPAAYAGNGKFVFDNVVPGTYTVRLQIAPAIAARQTYPAANNGFAVTTVGSFNAIGPFGVTYTPASGTFTVRGTAFVDSNANGSPDGTEVADANLFSWYVFVDTNNSGGLDDNDSFVTTVGTASSNGYALTLPADGRTYRVQLRNEFEGRPFTTATYYDVSSITAGQVITGKNFGIAPMPPDPPSVIHEGETATLTGGTAKGSSNGGYNGAGYADFGGNGSAVQWTTPRNATEQATLTFRYANGSTANRPLTIIVNGVTIGTLAFTPTGSWTTWKTVSITANLLAGTNTIKAVAGGATGANVDCLTVTRDGAPPVGTATLEGFLFEDTNKSGWYELGEPRPSGRVVFLDTDNDGVKDTGEQSVITTSDGEWAFSGLPTPGTYRVRQVLASGTVPSKTLDLVLDAGGQSISGLSIGSKTGTVPPPPPPPPPPAGTASLAGTAFRDNNKNGRYDTGDGIGKAITVFLDSDNDGTLDAGETRVVTDASGKFKFAGLAAGTYRLRAVLPAGSIYSTTRIDQALTSGQTKTGLLIGLKTA
jgi:uncharacterized delta-60 repeat protein